MYTVIRVATRNSALALCQANLVKSQLLEYYPDAVIELVPMTTLGDRFLTTSLSKIGGKGLFVKELEHGLLQYTADIAVHSMKDVPMQLAPGLEIAAVLPRGSVEDVLVSPCFHSLEAMPQHARIGTSSVRRKAILERYYPQLQRVDVRGNVQKRLDKCAEQAVDGLILAAAGLERLHLSHQITQRLAVEDWLPAPGQGAIGIEIRSSDAALKQWLQMINHTATWDAVLAERTVSRTLQGGCGVPLAAYAIADHSDLWLRAWFIEEASGSYAYAEMCAPRADAVRLGAAVAQKLCA